MEYQELVRTRLHHKNTAPLLCFGLLAAGFLAVCIYNLVGQAWMDALIMAVIAAVMGFLLVKSLPGQKYQQYCAEVRKLGKEADVFAHVGQLTPCAAAADADLRFDETYIAYVGRETAAIRAAGDLVWGYLHDSIGRKHFGIIPMGTEHIYGAMLCFADGSSFAVELQDQETVLAVLDQLKEAYPYMMRGYHPQLEAIFQKNPKELWSAAGYQNEQQDETV